MSTQPKGLSIVILPEEEETFISEEVTFLMEDGKNLAFSKIVSMKFPEEPALKVLQIKVLSH